MTPTRRDILRLAAAVPIVGAQRAPAGTVVGTATAAAVPDPGDREPPVCGVPDRLLTLAAAVRVDVRGADGPRGRSSCALTVVCAADGTAVLRIFPDFAEDPRPDAPARAVVALPPALAAALWAGLAGSPA